jgi:hypothetical protein
VRAFERGFVLGSFFVVALADDDFGDLALADR